MPEMRCLGFAWLVSVLAMLPALARAGETVQFRSAQIMNTYVRTDAPAPYAVDSGAWVGNWKTVALPHVLAEDSASGENPGALEHPSGMVSWIRFQLPDASAAGSRFLYIPRVQSDRPIAVYGDGRLLYKLNTDVFWNAWNTPGWVDLSEGPAQALPREIMLRVERPRSLNAAISTIWLGERADLAWRYQLRYVLQLQIPYTVSAIYMAMGLFFLIGWLRQRGNMLLLHCFCLSLASFFRAFPYYVGGNRLILPESGFTWLTINSQVWLILVIHFLLNHLHARAAPAFTRAVLYFSLGIGLGTVLIFATGAWVHVLSPLASALSLMMGLVVGAVGFYQSRRARSMHGMLLGAWCLLGMLFWLHDWLLQNSLIPIESIFIGSYANILAIFLMVIVVFRAYVGAVDEVRQVNATLGQRLGAREAELTESHRRQAEIARRQTLADERQRLMQDMHDGMGSSLRTALLDVEKGRVGPGAVAQVLRGCIEDLKLAIDAMEPVQADLLLLLATLRFRIGPRLENAGLTLRWDIQNVPPLEWIDPRNSLHILRILQEAFTNIINHSKASEIRVSTSVAQDSVLVVISDNGQGFDVARQLGGLGRGLSNQVRRAESIGGHVRWRSSAAGTELTLVLPIQRQSLPDAGEPADPSQVAVLR
jgi:signal transduction histidine kinase